MRESFAELVFHMADRLQPGVDGKPRIFRDSLVLNLREFMDTFSARNITKDQELEEIVSKAREILNGKSAADLRNFSDTRAKVQREFSEIKEKLDGMITIVPTRKFNFDE